MVEGGCAVLGSTRIGVHMGQNIFTPSGPQSMEGTLCQNNLDHVNILLTNMVIFFSTILNIHVYIMLTRLIYGSSRKLYHNLKPKEK